MVAAPRAGLAGKPMGAQAKLLGTMCGAHETFQDWLKLQERALCKTTSVTWCFSSRYSSVSRGYQNCSSIYFNSPLVRLSMRLSHTILPLIPYVRLLKVMTRFCVEIAIIVVPGWA